MSRESKIRITVTEGTITLVKNKVVVPISKKEKPELFKELLELAKTEEGVDKINSNFSSYIERGSSTKTNDFLERTSDYTSRVVLKGTNNPLPDDIFKKFQELRDSNSKDFLSLLKFWYKLDRNPSKNSREQLHRFIVSNNVPITSDGDIILEKGVYITEEGKLVDAHTGTIDNSVGRVVEMERDLVDDNPHQTCSTGLHAAPPDYVRQWYSGSNYVIVKVLVSPEDIVSVPVDYDSRKIRCCRYQVIGLSDKTKAPLGGDRVIRLEDLLADTEVIPTQHEAVVETILEDKMKDSTETFEVDATSLEAMTAKQIIKFIEENYGEKITLQPKNKKGVLRKAIEIVSSEKVKSKYIPEEKTQEDRVEEKTIQLPKTNKELIDIAKARFNESIGGRHEGKKPRKVILEKRFVELFENAGYTVIK